MTDNDREILKRLLPDQADYGQVGRVSLSENEFVEILVLAYSSYKSEFYRASKERNQNGETLGEHLAIDKGRRTAESTNNWYGNIIHFKLAWAFENPAIPCAVFAWAVYKEVPPATSKGYVPTSEGLFPTTYPTPGRLEPLSPQGVNFAQILFQAALPLIRSNVLTSVRLLNQIIFSTQKTAARFPFDDYLEQPVDGGRAGTRMYEDSFDIGRDKVKGVLSKAARRAGCEYKVYNSSGIAVATHPSSTGAALIVRWSAAQPDPRSTVMSYFIYLFDPYLTSELEKLQSYASQENGHAPQAGPDPYSLDMAYYRATSWVIDFIRLLKYFIEKSIAVPEAADRALIKRLMPEHADYAFIETFPVDEGQFVELLGAAFKRIFYRNKQTIVIDAGGRAAEATLGVVPISCESKVAKLLLRWLPGDGEPPSTAVAWTCYEYWTADVNKPARPGRVRYAHQGNPSLHHSVKEVLLKSVANSAGMFGWKKSFEQALKDKEALWQLLSSCAAKASTEEVSVGAGKIPEILRFMSRVEGKMLILYEDRMIAAFPHPTHALLLRWQPAPAGGDATSLCCLNYRVLQGEASGQDANVKAFLDDLLELVRRLPAASLDSID